MLGDFRRRAGGHVAVGRARDADMTLAFLFEDMMAASGVVKFSAIFFGQLEQFPRLAFLHTTNDSL